MLLKVHNISPAEALSGNLDEQPRSERLGKPHSLEAGRPHAPHPDKPPSEHFGTLQQRHRPVHLYKPLVQFCCITLTEPMNKLLAEHSCKIVAEQFLERRHIWDPCSPLRILSDLPVCKPSPVSLHTFLQDLGYKFNNYFL